MSLAEMRRRGILGINRRNAAYTLAVNDRARYPLVDDKLETKRLCREAGIPVPELLAVASVHHETRGLAERLRAFPAFVVKPARGAMGNGILVLEWRKEALFRGHRRFAEEDLAYHAGRHRVGPLLARRRPGRGDGGGAIVDRPLVRRPGRGRRAGHPRDRLPRRSDHGDGAGFPRSPPGAERTSTRAPSGPGVDLGQGTLRRGIHEGRTVERSPDTGAEIAGFTLPHFDAVLECAVRATDTTGLQYVGADVVVDARKGPVVLELNARPGLAIQLANAAGLRPRLDRVDALAGRPRDRALDAEVSARIAAGRELGAGAAA